MNVTLKITGSLITPVQSVSYLIMVIFGIVGNTVVIGVVGKGVLEASGSSRNSDMILVNMAVSNLLLSLTRNILLVLSDWVTQWTTTIGWCHFLMGLWVWLRSVNVWSTFLLSVFHFHTLRRVTVTVSGNKGPPKHILGSFSIIWILNLIYSIPAFIYSTRGGKNSTETVMLVSSTTRPLLGCIWSFPSVHSALAFATSSMVIHECIPIILMIGTNLGSLLMLYAHGRSLQPLKVSPDAPAMKRVPAERRAAKVILALIFFFTLSWGTSIISVNYFNYSEGNSRSVLLTVARFSNSGFIAVSPVVVAVGHRRLRAFFKSLQNICWPQAH
ncbi:olfactory receptor class A-like protein 4 [Denticeps clupeoides]|uniref:olfactory receptor class A-like protein 4 n=1 Tax=Denticeps clupeoides TaxID=299321 RepID=UPI0010A4D81B|nr:olfactory receptor class A-like protein 4 [Denticeps clupeoides]